VHNTTGSPCFQFDFSRHQQFQRKATSNTKLVRPSNAQWPEGQNRDIEIHDLLANENRVAPPFEVCILYNSGVLFKIHMACACGFGKLQTFQEHWRSAFLCIDCPTVGEISWDWAICMSEERRTRPVQRRVRWISGVAIPGTIETGPSSTRGAVISMTIWQRVLKTTGYAIRTLSPGITWTRTASLSNRSKCQRTREASTLTS
jgi:hypothetical protein